MADIELVIKINEDAYKAIKNMSVVGDMTIPYVFDAIRIGIPLPKGHGDLIDKSAYRKEFLNSRDFEPMKILDFQPIIIEVEKNETHYLF